MTTAHSDNIEPIMRNLFIALVAVLFSTSSAPGQAQRAIPTRQAIPVTVILTSDYPAFNPTPQNASAATLRAIIRFDTPDDPGAAVVLLNPSFASDQTLFEAFSVVRRTIDGAGERPKYVPIGVTPAVRQPASPVANQLNAILARLRVPDAPRASLHRSTGTRTTTPDIRRFFR